MAKIIIAGNSCTLESAFTTANLKKLEKYRPASLQLMDKDKNVEFIIRAGAVGSISPKGIVFDGTTHDGNKHACITQMLPADLGDVKGWVMDNIGFAILKLNKLEESLSEVITNLNGEVAAVENTISIIGGSEAADEAAE